MHIFIGNYGFIHDRISIWINYLQEYSIEWLLIKGPPLYDLRYWTRQNNLSVFTEFAKSPLFIWQLFEVVNYFKYSAATSYRMQYLLK